jgi:hypothetical protein
MKTIRNYSRVWISLVLVGAFLATTAIFAAPSAKELQSLADQAYGRHNYKQAIEYADSLLKGEPKGDSLRAAQRTKAMAMCMYKRVSGVKYAKGIMGEHEPFKVDAELWYTIGVDGQHRHDRKSGYEGYFKAATLYERQKKLVPAADAWFKAAEMLGRSYNITPRMLAQKALGPIEDKLVDWPNDWNNRQKVNLLEVL